VAPPLVADAHLAHTLLLGASSRLTRVLFPTPEDPKSATVRLPAVYARTSSMFAATTCSGRT